MLIDSFNLNLLRVFEVVYRTRSMTKAAGELHMTQSGVSQNIRNLEEVTGLKLFDRVKQRPLPTHSADELYSVTQNSLNSLEEILSALTGVDKELKGEIRIGLPLEFGNNLVLPLVARWGSEHPRLRFSIKYGHASEMNQQILQGDLDFAFLDEFRVDRAIEQKKVMEETLVLCCSNDYAKRRNLDPQNSAKFFQSLDFVDYVEGAPVLKMWFDHHLKRPVDINVRASLMDVQGMSRVITQGLGAGILPLHVVDRLSKEGNKFQILRGSGRPLKNIISVAYLKDRTQSPAVKQSLEYILDGLKELAKKLS